MNHQYDNETLQEPISIGLTNLFDNFYDNNCNAVALAKCLSYAFQSDPMMCLSIILASLSAISQGKFVVETPSGMTEELSTFFICIAAPSEGKSHLFKEITKGLRQIENEENRDNKLQKKKAIIKNKLLQKKIDSIYGKIKKEDIDPEAALEKICSLEDEKMPVPSGVQLVAEDITASSLVELLNMQTGNRISIFDPEGGAFEEIAKDKRLLKHINSGFSGDQIEKNRTGKEKIVIQNTRISLLLMIQPARLREIKNLQALWENGFFSRVIAVFSDSYLAKREPKELKREYFQEQLNNFYESLKNIHKIEWNLSDSGEIIPYRLKMDGQAKTEWLKRYSNVQNAISSGNLDEHQYVLGKRAGYLARIAALLHILGVKNPHSKLIGVETINYACEILNYVDCTSNSTEKLRSIIFESKKDTDINAIMKWIKSHQRIEFSAREIYNSGKKVPYEIIKQILVGLASQGVISTLPESPSHPQGGRPKNPRYMYFGEAAPPLSPKYQSW